ncbi:hypothetical protein DV737_g5595, partial [Chaetothyriales sp. CBS 132003]
MATHSDVSGADAFAQALKSAEDEQAYQESVHSIERVFAEEGARELRVQLLLLEDENDMLQAELEQCDANMEQLENSKADLRDELGDAKAQLAQVQTDLKMRLRDLDHARAEVRALNNASTDAANILADKLALARELATLKAELEHAKAQRGNQDNMLAEKLALQREISAMQVELDNERRTVQRLKSQGKASSEEESALAAEVAELKKDLALARKAATSKADRQKTEIFELKAELERLRQESQRVDAAAADVDELRKELARSKKEAQKAEKDQMKKASDWDRQKEMLESKLEAFRTKLRATKEQLRTAQDELETAQVDRMAQSAELTKARMVRKTAPAAASANASKRHVARFDPDATIGTPGQGPAKRQRTSVSVGDKSTVSMTPFFNKTALSMLAEISSVGDEDSADKAADKAANEAANDSINGIVEEARDGVAKKPHRPAKRPNIFDDDNDDARAPAAPKIKSLKGGGLANVSLLAFGRGKSKTLAQFSPLKKERRGPSVALEHYSSKRWVQRQSSDSFTRAAKVAGLKSRAAFKLLQINDRYGLFKPGMTVVDLGFAPGSWSQVAVDLTQPAGRVLGVDLIPAQPPKGVNTIQGDFLSPAVQAEIKNFLKDPDRGRLRRPAIPGPAQPHGGAVPAPDNALITETGGRSYLDMEREHAADNHTGRQHSDLCVDLVLSDMSAPWDLLDGLYKKSISNPYYRLMNTSGNAFRDHAGSMDLCTSALRFCFSTLKTGGHFVCKFYQGAEDKLLEKRMKAMFHKVAREKPESSRSASKEAYMVGVKRLAKVDEAAIFADG